MGKCYQHFSMFDLTPQPQTPDNLLQLLDVVEATPEVMGQEQPTANLDIIISKFLNNEGLNDIQLQQLSQKQREVFEEVRRKGIAVKKRPDQYQKLFYRRAFKYAEREFFGKRKKNKSRKMSCFYHHYFGETAQDMSVPLVNFYHPDKKTRPGLRVGQKSFNRSYVRLLLRSEIFRDVSRAYRKRFIDDCLDERKKKVGKFVSYLKGVVGKYGADGNKMREVIRSSKCKVPWSNLEIAEADKRAIEDLERYQLQFRDIGGDEDQEESCSSCSEDVSEQTP